MLFNDGHQDFKFICSQLFGRAVYQEFLAFFNVGRLVPLEPFQPLPKKSVDAPSEIPALPVHHATAGAAPYPSSALATKTFEKMPTAAIAKTPADSATLATAKAFAPSTTPAPSKTPAPSQMSAPLISALDPFPVTAEATKEGALATLYKPSESTANSSLEALLNGKWDDIDAKERERDLFVPFLKAFQGACTQYETQLGADEHAHFLINPAKVDEVRSICLPSCSCF